jgi:hypothetical protein
MDTPCSSLLYHTRDLNIWAAESAWISGHRDLNTCAAEGSKDPNPRRNSHTGTPLWLISSTIDEPTWQPKSSTFYYLLEHGAEAFWIHPLYLTTPFHILARQASRIRACDGHARPLKDADDLFLKDQTDECDCYCSRKGCYAIGSALSRSSLSYGPDDIHTKKAIAFHRGTMQPRLFALVHSNREATWMSSAVFRVLIFEALSLTHT